MKILSERFDSSDNATISRLSIDGNHVCYILEDVDRGLTSNMMSAEISKLKMKGKTAIPTGSYQIVITHSNRFKRLMPLLLNVPGFDGIRIHSGNTHAHTDGCLLPGKSFARPFGEFEVWDSRIATATLAERISESIKQGEEVWIEIVNAITN